MPNSYSRTRSDATVLSCREFATTPDFNRQKIWSLDVFRMFDDNVGLVARPSRHTPEPVTDWPQVAVADCCRLSPTQFTPPDATRHVVSGRAVWIGLDIIALHATKLFQMRGARCKMELSLHCRRRLDNRAAVCVTQSHVTPGHKVMPHWRLRLVVQPCVRTGIWSGRRVRLYRHLLRALLMTFCNRLSVKPRSQHMNWTELNCSSQTSLWTVPLKYSCSELSDLIRCIVCSRSIRSRSRLGAILPDSNSADTGLASCPVSRDADALDF